MLVSCSNVDRCPASSHFVSRDRREVGGVRSIMPNARTSRLYEYLTRTSVGAAVLSLLSAPGALGQLLVLSDGRKAEHVEWQVKGDFKNNKDISGLACADD